MKADDNKGSGVATGRLRCSFRHRGDKIAERNFDSFHEFSAFWLLALSDSPSLLLSF